jgi:hypothetical protein
MDGEAERAGTFGICGNMPAASTAKMRRAD